jgi:hypothetical protein
MNLQWLAALFFSCTTLQAQSAYLGFDRNDYPGDASLKALRQTFSYSGYWLNNPPGEKTTRGLAIALRSNPPASDSSCCLTDASTPN